MYLNSRLTRHKRATVLLNRSVGAYSLCDINKSDVVASRRIITY